MKYLKTYESYSDEDIIRDCKDIFIDLIQEGIRIFVDVSLVSRNGETYELIDILIGNNRNSFDPKICIDPLIHLNSFLNEKGYSYFSNGTVFTTFKSKINNLNEGGRLLLLGIQFKKTEVGK